MDECIYGLIDGRMEVRVNVCKDGWIDEWMDGCTYGNMNGWMDI